MDCNAYYGLEDDVVRIELQTVSGIVLTAIGLPYDDYQANYPYPLSPRAFDVVNYNTGINSNDAPISTMFPYVAEPWSGKHNCDCGDMQQTTTKMSMDRIATAPVTMGLATPELVFSNSPNPVSTSNNLQYHVSSASRVQITLVNASGVPVKVLVDKKQDAGTYNVQWSSSGLTKGAYFISASKDGEAKQTITLIKN